MIARVAATLGSLAAALLIGACTNYVEIPVETPIQPKLDVSAFQRVLVVGFVAGGTEDVDANLETVRLLRSQLRTKSNMKVIEADPLPLTQVAADADAGQRPGGRRGRSGGQRQALPKQIKDEKDLEAYDYLFANVELLEEARRGVPEPADRHRHGALHAARAIGFVQREQEVIDAYGRRSVRPVRTYMERKGFILRPKFIFIDGRTGSDALLGDVPRGGPLQPAAGHARARRPTSS